MTQDRRRLVGAAECVEEMKALAQFVKTGQQSFTFNTRRCAEATVVTAEGELDITVKPVLPGALAEAVTVGRPVVVNLSGVRFCGAAAIGVLHNAHLLARAAGVEMVLIASTRPVLRPLALLDATHSLHVVGDKTTAAHTLGLFGCTSAEPRATDLAATTAVTGMP